MAPVGRAGTESILTSFARIRTPCRRKTRPYLLQSTRHRDAIDFHSKQLKL